MRLKRELIKEAARFGMVGVTATIIHYATYWMLLNVINANIAYSIGYFVSFLFNYYLSARFTFKRKTSVKNGFGFAGAHVFNYLLQVALLNVFIYLGVSKILAPLPVYCIAVPTNFLIVRFVFRKS